jgi:hypothetical protein
VIGDEADVFATERGEFFGFEDIEASLNTANVAMLGLRGLLGCDSEVRQENAGQQRKGKRAAELAEGAVQTADRFHSFQ